MTDHEPLRVGPLVLRWREWQHGDHAYGARLGPHAALYVYRQLEHWSFLVVCSRGDVDEIVGNHRDTPEQAAEAARVFLTETGYLAQYRSRRRLLAEKLLLLSKRHTLCGGSYYYTRKRGQSWHSAIAAKYARWANQLKDSP